MTLQYSRWTYSNETYNDFNVVGSWNSEELAFRNPNKRIDLENMKSICSLKDNFRSKITPKSFTLSKVSSRTELISYSKEIWVLDLVKETEWHFLILRVSKLLKHQLDIEVRSYWRSWQSDGSRIFLKTLRSPVNKRQFEYFKTEGNSLINIFPCGHQT